MLAILAVTIGCTQWKLNNNISRVTERSSVSYRAVICRVTEWLSVGSYHMAVNELISPNLEAIATLNHGYFNYMFSIRF